MNSTYQEPPPPLETSGSPAELCTTTKGEKKKKKQEKKKKKKEGRRTEGREGREGGRPKPLPRARGGQVVTHTESPCTFREEKQRDALHILRCVRACVCVCVCVCVSARRLPTLRGMERQRKNTHREATPSAPQSIAASSRRSSMGLGYTSRQPDVSIYQTVSAEECWHRLHAFVCVRCCTFVPAAVLHFSMFAVWMDKRARLKD